MKRFFWLFLLVVTGGFSLKAQNILPPVYEINADTAAYQLLADQYVQVLEDSADDLSIDDVSGTGFTNKFHANNTGIHGINYHISSYWFRYRMKNVLNHPVTLAFFRNGTYSGQQQEAAYVWLYTREADKPWIAMNGGNMMPRSKRSGFKSTGHIVVNLAPGEERLFYEKETIDFTIVKPKRLQLSIGFQEPVIRQFYYDIDQTYASTVYFSILGGILLLAGLINMFFYTTVRERVYLYFALYLVLLSMNYLWFVRAFFRDSPYARLYIGFAALTLSRFVFVYFIRQFLSTADHTPRWDSVLKWFGIATLIASLLARFLPAYVPYHAELKLSLNIVIGTFMPLILLTLLFYIRRTKGHTVIGIIAVIPVMAWFGFWAPYSSIYQELHYLFGTSYPMILLWLRSSVSAFAELFGYLWLVVVFCWLLFKRFGDMQQSLVQSALDHELERNTLIAKQNIELEHQVANRTAELRLSIDELKTTQQQLIQSEKLASLGELTAGIAHEIQNPLNFVNNFSEVSMELTEEMKQELQRGNTADAAALADDIEQNLQKIIHHGKRADAIVRNMLQHSRSNSGQKEPTDINALADEFLRLSYHGLRAKDKSFNSEMVTRFDAALPKVTVIPQDFGRVLLNLFNNAFYAVHQRKKSEGGDFKPMVEITTVLRSDNTIEIHVRDNGTGIPTAVKEKILQPFFTTKPAGEGTGLGLSLSYDIVVKGHGGKIDVFSEEGVYTEFVIVLSV